MHSRHLAFATILFLALGTLPGASAEADNLVASVVKAPVVPDGDVAGAITDVVVNLDISPDPAVAGRSLPAGCSIKVTLPEEFVNTGDPPLMDLFSSPACVPPITTCSTAVLLQGWPQHPILPVFPPPGAPNQYALSLDGPNTIVYTALVDIVPGLPLPGPGIKQMHLILTGWRNPTRPGLYDVEVEVQTGPACEPEHGTGRLHILPKVRPSINVTSAFNAGAPNTIFQTTSPGALTPLPYDFLIWDRDGGPLEGVTAEMVDGNLALLRQGTKAVGHVKVVSPVGADGQEVFTEVPSFAINSPVTGIPTGRLTAKFRAGSETGLYELHFTLHGGNEVTMYVTAE